MGLRKKVNLDLMFDILGIFIIYLVDINLKK